jgi:putative transposase
VCERGDLRHEALVVAKGVHETGRREMLGVAVSEAESEASPREFLRNPVSHGLNGVRLAISDAHEGLARRAIAQVLGCSPAEMHSALPP